MKQMVRKKECSTKTKNTESLVRTKMDDKVISTNLPLFSSALIVLAAWKVTKMKDVTVAKEELKLFGHLLNTCCVVRTLYIPHSPHHLLQPY